MKRFFATWCVVALMGASSLAAAQQPAATEREPSATEREPSAELRFLFVPYGGSYQRSAVGITAVYQIPLIQKPGALWETTNVTVGLNDLYSYVNNSVGGFVEITPIAVLALRVSATYDRVIIDPFTGGIRVLTAMGRQLLDDEQFERGNENAIDWVDGRENSNVFLDPSGGGGLRLKIQPTLQAKVGPVAIQYKFTADFNYYSASDFDESDIFYDSLTFTLRELHDRSFLHELLVAYTTERERGQRLPGEILAGVRGSYQTVSGTGLDNLAVNAVLLYRPKWEFFGDKWKPFFAVQLGTHLSDPMHEGDFAWLLVSGMNRRLF